MTDETNLQKLKKEYSSNLIELSNHEKFAPQIVEICLKNNIEDEKKVEKIAYHIASVLLGNLPLEILPKILAINLEIDIELAKKISEEANQLIFSQVKDDLDNLYPPFKPEKPASAPPEPKEVSEEKPERPFKKDIYKEPIE